MELKTLARTSSGVSWSTSTDGREGEEFSGLTHQAGRGTQQGWWGLNRTCLQGRAKVTPQPCRAQGTGGSSGDRPPLPGDPHGCTFDAEGKPQRDPHPPPVTPGEQRKIMGLKPGTITMAGSWGAGGPPTPEHSLHRLSLKPTSHTQAICMGPRLSSRKRQTVPGWQRPKQQDLLRVKPSFFQDSRNPQRHPENKEVMVKPSNTHGNRAPCG